jgi:hypothetical protein
MTERFQALHFCHQKVVNQFHKFSYLKIHEPSLVKLSEQIAYTLNTREHKPKGLFL